MKKITNSLICLILLSCSVKPTQNRKIAGFQNNTCLRLYNIIASEDYFDESASQLIINSFSKIKALDVDLVRASRLPNWEEVEELKNILKEFKKFDEVYEFPSQKDRSEFLQRLFFENFEDDLEFSKFIHKVSEKTTFEEFQLAEQELIYHYRVLFEQINSYLPDDLRIKLQKLELEKYRELNTKKAEDMMEDQLKLVDSLNPSSGYKTYSSLKGAITKTKDELGPVVDLVRKEEIEFSMDRPERSRWWIPKVGFHNQHVTGSSGGYRGVEGRNATEASLLGKKYDEFASLDNELKPKYGYLRTKMGSEIKSFERTHYGGDLYTFKKSSLKKRVTFTPGDSLNRHSKFNPNWRNGETATPEFWDDTFMPWDRKEFLIPFSAYSVRENKSFTYSSSEKVLDQLQNFKMRTNVDFSQYLEMQFWGPLRLDDVERFMFRSVEPDEEFYNELVKHDIEIYDGRQTPPVKWKPNFQKDEVDKIKVEKRVFGESSEKIDADFKIDLIGENPPKGELKPLERSFGSTEARGSTEPNWFIDEDGVEWLLKDDQIYSELQTSAEVISSSIYRLLGFNAPETHIITYNGKRYAAVRSLGKDLKASTLEENQTEKWKSLFFIAALLKDHDRIYSAKNNFDLGNGEFAIFDFGGTLGSKARGEHKKVWPGFTVFSDAIGMFENTQDFEVIYGWFKSRHMPDGHAWQNLKKSDMANALLLLDLLTNEKIAEIVSKAKFSKKEDADYMIEALIKRRDGLQLGLSDLMYTE